MNDFRIEAIEIAAMRDQFERGDVLELAANLRAERIALGDAVQRAERAEEMLKRIAFISKQT